MDPLSIGLITGGANLLGSIFTSDTSAKNTQAQIQASQQQQATQNAFTEQMSNTAYQRASADMKAAGLNPMMMFGSGAAASTPSGSSIQAPMPQTTSKMAGLGQAVSSGLSAAITAKSMDKMTDEIANLQQQNALLQAQTKETGTRSELEGSEASLRRAQTSTQQYVTAQERNRAITATNEANIDPSTRSTADKTGYFANKAKQIIEPIAQLGSSATGVGRALADSAFRRRFYFGE